MGIITKTEFSKNYKEYFMKLGILGYFYYFKVGKTIGVGSMIGPSTFGRSKRTWVRHSRKHWYGVNSKLPPRWLKIMRLPFNISLIGIDFGRTKLPFAIELIFN